MPPPDRLTSDAVGPSARPRVGGGGDVSVQVEAMALALRTG